MKKILGLITGLMFTLSMTVAAGAYTITYNHDLAGNGNDFIAPATPFIYNQAFNDFEGGVNSAGTLAGNFDIVTGLTVDHNAPPFGLSLTDSTKYLTVPQNVNIDPVSATLSFGQTYDYLGLWWGSIDSYNTLSFLQNGNLVLAFTGSQLPTPTVANGAQLSNLSNQYVNFYGISFDAIQFTSTRYAFEVDNIKVGNVVPEPGTMMLLGIGMLGLAVYGKRRLNKEV